MIPFFIIILTHWIADFIFQDEKWALGKSKNWSDLLSHTGTYSVLWTIPILWFTHSIGITLLFVLITFLAHTATDYVTSRIVSKKFAKGEYGSPIPNLGGFSVIGFDQVLHYTQLYLTWYFLIGPI